MSFARNFEAGQRIAQSAMDTFNSARMKRDLAPIMSGEAETIQKFDDPEQMEAMANAINPETGKPYYEFVDNGRGGLNLKSNFSYAGADGNMVAPGTQTAPYDRTRFLGKDFNRVLNEDEVDTERMRAAANVIGRNDPMRGLELRRQLKQDARDDERFGWERQSAPLKIRAAELGVNAAERADVDGKRQVEVRNLVDEVAKMPKEALQAYAAKLNTNASNLPFLSVGQTEEGYKFLTVDPETGFTGKEFTMNETQLRDMAAASVLGMAGYGQESMELLRTVNKDIASIVEGRNKNTERLVSSANDATGRGRQDGFRQQGVDLERARLNEQIRSNGVTERIAGERLNQEKNPLKQKIETLQQFLGRDLSEQEVMALGGLKLDGPDALNFVKTDDGGFFEDKTGTPVGRLDPVQGLVPYGNDPRQNQEIVRAAERNGVRIASVISNGRPVWAFIGKDGEAYDNVQDAVNPPMRDSDVQDLSQLRGLLDTRRAQLRAVANSGDQQAIARAAQEVQGLERTLRAAANERFGTRADEYLRQN